MYMYFTLMYIVGSKQATASEGGNGAYCDSRFAKAKTKDPTAMR